MNIETGLFDHMVLQRAARSVSDAFITGRTEAAGNLLARVTRKGKVVKGLDAVVIGRARNGRFRARLVGVPAGGPYDVELCVERRGEVREKTKVKDVLVGDVWILGGQSNMEGCGLLAQAEKPDPMVRAFYMDDRWGVAKDRLHNLSDAVDPVHADLCGGQRPARNLVTGVGPGVSFAKELHRLTGVPQGVLACGHGGTSMAQWDPKRKGEGGKSLYGATMRRLARNGGRVAGLAWYQGCSDCNEQAAPLYTDRMKELVKAFRRDTGSPKLPVVIVQISRVIGWGADSHHWNSVQDQQRRLQDLIKGLAVVPAIDLSLEDPIHINGADQCRLGRRMAQAMHTLTGGPGKPPIMLGKIRVEPNPRHGMGDIVVEFRNVVGKLRSQGPATGFSMTRHGNIMPAIYRVDLQGNAAILRTQTAIRDLAERELWHGQGFCPYCNITDAADRSLPVLGPIAIAKPRAMTPQINSLRVSPLLPSAGKLHDLAHPADLGALGLAARTFPQAFCDLHPELSARAPEDLLVWYACRFRCDEPMKLKVWLGYDGPVKAWLDGQVKFHDPDGTNPAYPQDAAMPLDAAAGEHEVLVALGSNEGRAWGIFLAIERLDVSKAALLKGPAAYRLPTVLG